MNEELVEKWAKELLHRSYRRSLEYLPNGFYRELNDKEKAEVMRRYKDRLRKFPPRYETKGGKENDNKK